VKPIIDLLAVLNPVFQALTLIALVIYVWKTWEMAKATSAAAIASENSLREMRLTREQQIKPYVICYFQDIPASKFFEFVIKNGGSAMAFDVQLVFDPQLQNYNPGHSAPGLASKAFKTLAPGHEWRTFWGSFVGMDEQAVPDEFVAHVSYRWGPNRRLEEYDISFDLKSLMGKRYLSRSSVEGSLAAIATTLSELSRGLANGPESTDA